MDKYTDQAKGKAKQVLGDVTGDEELHAEGEADEAAGDAKQVVDKIADALHEGIDWIADQIKRLSK